MPFSTPDLCSLLFSLPNHNVFAAALDSQPSFLLSCQTQGVVNTPRVELSLPP